MTPEFTLTLNIAQMVLLGGLIWATAKLSASVDTNRDVTKELTSGLKVVTDALTSIALRVGILEDRGERKPFRRDDPR